MARMGPTIRVQRSTSIIPLYRGWRISVASADDDVPIDDNSQDTDSDDAQETGDCMICDKHPYETRTVTHTGSGSPNVGHSNGHCGTRGCSSTFCLQCIVDYSESEQSPHRPICGEYMSKIGYGVWERRITEVVAVCHSRTDVNHVVVNIPAAHKLFGGYDEGVSLLGLYNEYETKFWEFDGINVRITIPTRNVFFPRFRDCLDSEDFYTMWQYARLLGVYKWAELQCDADKTKTFFLPMVATISIKESLEADGEDLRLQQAREHPSKVLHAPMPTRMVRKFLRAP